MATWADVQKYMPAHPSSYGPPDESGSYGNTVPWEARKPTEIPGVGTVTWEWNGSEWQAQVLDPSSRTMKVLGPGAGGEIAIKDISYGDNNPLKDLLPVAAVALGGPMMGSYLNSMGSLGWTGATEADLAMELGGGMGEGFWEVGSSGLGGMSGGNLAGDAIAGGGAASLAGTAYGGSGALSALNNIAKSPAGTSAIQKILSGSGGMQDWLSLLGPAMSIYSGVEGLDRAKDMNNLISGDVGGALGQLGALGITSPSLSPVSSPGITPPTFTTPSLDPITGRPVDRSAQAKAAIAGADPWGASGGRALADEQLQALMRSPGSLLSDPGYQAKMMGVDRVMAAQGQLGGGGGAVAAANASGDYYQQRLAALASLENMGNPVGAWQLGLGQEQLGLAEGQLNLQGQVANSGQTLDLGRLGVSQAQTNLTGQVAAANQGIQLGQLDTQRGQLDLDAQKAMANLGVTKGQLGLDAAKLKLAAAGGANTLAGQSLASIGYGVTQATGGTTEMDQARKFLQALRASGASV